MSILIILCIVALCIVFPPLMWIAIPMVLGWVVIMTWLFVATWGDGR